MALFEGGSWKCDRHNFQSTDEAEINKHGSDGDHFENGTTVCISCGAPIEFSNLPFVPFKQGSKGLLLTCDDCEGKRIGNATIKRTGPANASAKAATATTSSKTKRQTPTMQNMTGPVACF